MKKSDRKKRWKKTLLSCLLLLSLLAGAVGTAPITAKAVEANAVNDARYAVVRILAIKEDGYVTRYGLGTGFGVGTGDGYADTFVTNWHVVTGSGSYDYRDADIYILLDDTTIFNYVYDPDDDDDVDDDDYSLESVTLGNAVKCEVLYAEQQYPDVAILKTEEPVQGVEKLALRGVTQSLVGQTVYTIGYPASADTASRVYSSNGYRYSETIKASVSAVSVATGTVSRCLQMEGMGNTYCVEHDAHINHGNSGGPLILADGSVIGINTYGYGDDDLDMEYSVSIYIDYAMEVLDDLGIAYKVADDSTETTTEEPTETTTEEPTETTTEEPTETTTEEPTETTTERPTETATEEPTTKSPDVPTGVWVGLGVGVLVLVVLVIAVVTAAGKKKQNQTGASATIQNQGAAEAGATNAGGGGAGGAAVAGAVGSGVAGAQAEYRIQGIAGAFAGRRFRLEAETYIGRTGDHGGITYPEGTAGVSGHHCVIRLRNGSLSIADLGSTYGTYVNGTKIPVNQFVTLRVGDVISIGSDREKFQITRPGGAIS